MAGFNKIKRVLKNSKDKVVLQDIEPFEIEYQKFYDNDEYDHWIKNLIYDLSGKLECGSYTLEIDTLGAYGSSSHKFEVDSILTRHVIFK